MKKNGRMLNKVPEITIYFWIIKILCTTVGETGADYLTYHLHLGLMKTTLIATVLLEIVLSLQFRAKKYIPWIYWLNVVLISIVGTLITDDLTDKLAIPLEISTAVFGTGLAIVFAFWYAKERTLSIHTIYTKRRETFYWLAILFTFALGTAAGDLFAERLNLGYQLSALIFAGLVAVVTLIHFIFRPNPVITFWVAYILTRPQGASLADYMMQTKYHGGLGWGAVAVNNVFFIAILALVAFLTITKKDAPQE